MADVNLDAKRTIGDNYGNQVSIARVVYDNAVDVVTTSDQGLVLKTDDDIVITDFYMNIITTFTSGGAATLDVGISGGDEDLLLDGIAVANMTAGVIFQPFIIDGTPNVLPMPFALDAAGEIIMTIGTADFTAGKAEFVFQYLKL